MFARPHSGALSGALVLMALACPPALAQPTGRPVYEGAGGDPRISVSQPESTSQASGGYVRSIEPSLGPLGDPFGLRPLLKQRGI